MKKVKILFFITTLVILLSSGVTRTMKSAGPPSCHAGEPPNNTNCTSCHNDAAVNTGTATVTLDLGNAAGGYIPGETYTFGIRVSKPGMNRAGFQFIALMDQDIKTSPGKITLTDLTRTQILDKNSPHSGGCLEEEKVWTEHTYQGISVTAPGENNWAFEWTAPATDAGSVTFYLAALEANNDLTESGDFCYTRKTTISMSPLGLKKAIKKALFKVFANSATGYLFIEGEVSGINTVNLTDAQGKILHSWKKNELKVKDDRIVLPLQQVPGGIYYLRIQSTDIFYTEKIFIQ